MAAALPRIGGPLRALNGRGHDLRTRLTRAPLLVASRCAGEKGANPRARGARPIARAPTLAPGSPRATPAAQALERRARADHAVARRPTAAGTVRRDPPRALALLEHASRARGAIRPRPRRALAARPAHTLHARGPRVGFLVDALGSDEREADNDMSCDFSCDAGCLDDCGDGAWACGTCDAGDESRCNALDDDATACRAGVYAQYCEEGGGKPGGPCETGADGWRFDWPVAYGHCGDDRARPGQRRCGRPEGAVYLVV